MTELELDAVIDRLEELDDRLEVRFRKLAAIYNLWRSEPGYDRDRETLERAAARREPVHVTLVSNRIERVVAAAEGTSPSM